MYDRHNRQKTDARLSMAGERYSTTLESQVSDILVTDGRIFKYW